MIPRAPETPSRPQLTAEEARALKSYDEIWVPRLDHPLRDTLIDGKKHYACHWRRTRVILITDTGVGYNHISCHLGFASWGAVALRPPLTRGIHANKQPADVTLAGWINADSLQPMPIAALPTGKNIL